MAWFTINYYSRALTNRLESDFRIYIHRSLSCGHFEGMVYILCLHQIVCSSPNLQIQGLGVIKLSWLYISRCSQLLIAVLVSPVRSRGRSQIARWAFVLSIRGFLRHRIPSLALDWATRADHRRAYMLSVCLLMCGIFFLELDRIMAHVALCKHSAGDIWRLLLHSSWAWLWSMLTASFFGLLKWWAHLFLWLWLLSRSPRAEHRLGFHLQTVHRAVHSCFLLLLYSSFCVDEWSWRLSLLGLALLLRVWLCLGCGI